MTCGCKVRTNTATRHSGMPQATSRSDNCASTWAGCGAERAPSISQSATSLISQVGIEAELIDLRTLRPLDKGTVIESVKKTNRIVSVEQGWPICSIGSEIAAAVIDEAFDYLDAPPIRITGKDVPMPYAANLEKMALPSVDDVVSAAKRVCYR